MSDQRYPLHWPSDQPRTRVRREGNFKVTFGQARDELQQELDRHKATKVVLSTNIELNLSGLPRSGIEPADPGVAVYFERKGKPLVVACDSYHKVTHNLRAVGLTLRALRDVERYAASELLERAFTGFAALPPSASERKRWWEVLNLPPTATEEDVLAQRRALASNLHPDLAGGDGERMAFINAAVDEFRKERSR